ncbi:His-Xaa-Ser system protein HxsD [Malaciobacter halophilus]|nr:His-Xaa-Ser system protein HxsD [Malaciobacter halophilus]RYA23631.1 His-Xaa-Ser system protein HxsD [Malaciobacter halophilus]
MNTHTIEIRKGIFQNKIENSNLYTLNLAKEYFEKEPIMQAIHEYSDKFFVTMKPLNEKFVSVTFNIKDRKENTTDIDLIENFSNRVIDYQIRNDLEKNYGHIRDTIVEYAYSPVKKKMI